MARGKRKTSDDVPSDAPLRRVQMVVIICCKSICRKNAGWPPLFFAERAHQLIA